jgi:hypothetical protein
VGTEDGTLDQAITTTDGLEETVKTTELATFETQETGTTTGELTVEGTLTTEGTDTHELRET